jgi:chromate reductase, NAD(P)H dehydrogenase (quinone)
MRVLGISGSLRGDSHNSALLRTAGRRLPAGAEFEIWSGLAALPAYNEDLERAGAPASAAELRRAIWDADAIVIATPEYNHSIPGALKNAIDWASRPAGRSALNGKPAVVIGASTGMFGAVWAQAEMRKVLAATGARVLEEDLPVGHAHEHRRSDGALDLEPEQDERLRGLLAELVGSAERESELVAA